MAVEAARRAFNGEWRMLDTSVRGELLYKLSGLVGQHADVLATIDAWDNGTRVFHSARYLSTSNLYSDDIFYYRQGLSFCP
jgi:acyl-CoA reductase-like NAD-dependent aldehyde dehydrogenase